jgi:hypothetical protein
MRSFVPALFTTVLLTAAQAGFGAPHPNEAQYMYGTVKTIPTNTVGSLDLTDPSALQFQYGNSKYKLEYHQIKSFRFSDVKSEPRTIVHVPVPKLPFHSREQVLDISFYEKEGKVGTVSFRLTGKNLNSAEWMLSERIRLDKVASENAGRTKLPESWWGDKYWKTNRNKPAWPDANAEAVGTKE